MRLISVVLIAGGIAGIGVALWFEAGAHIRSHLAFLGLATTVFGWSIWVGVDLWRGRPQGYTWAKVLFALQVPSISLHGFAYQFYVGSILTLSFTQEAASKLNLEFQLGSLLKVQFSSEVESLVVGVNLLAIICLAYLFKKSPRRTSLARPQAVKLLSRGGAFSMVLMMTTTSVLLKCAPFFGFAGIGFYLLCVSFFPSWRPSGWRHSKFYAGCNDIDPHLVSKALGFAKSPKPRAEGYWPEETARRFYLWVGIIMLLVAFLGIRHLAGVPELVPDVLGGLST